ncbi:hypothetical protein D3C87_1073350 [compost metagenome]
MARCWVRPISTPKPNSVPVANAMKASSRNSSPKKWMSSSSNKAAHSHSSSQVRPVKASASARVNPFCQARSNSAAYDARQSPSCSRNCHHGRLTNTAMPMLIENGINRLPWCGPSGCPLKFQPIQLARPSTSTEASAACSHSRRSRSSTRVNATAVGTLSTQVYQRTRLQKSLNGQLSPASCTAYSIRPCSRAITTIALRVGVGSAGWAFMRADPSGKARMLAQALTPVARAQRVEWAPCQSFPPPSPITCWSRCHR